MTQPTDPIKGLPPKPDPVTGEPRPPHAPHFRGNEKYNESSQESRQSRKPAPPPGQSPVLAWRQANRWAAVQAGLWGFGLLVVLTSLITLPRGKGPFHWMTLWPVWLVIVIAVVAATLTIGSDRCSAGADWLKYRKSWVRTYELSVITVRYSRGKPTVRLTDQDKRVIDVEAESLWADRLIWDLLYNGIRHSAAHGAAVNDAARGWFELT